MNSPAIARNAYNRTRWSRLLLSGITWISLGMGLTLLAPGWSARLFGLGERPWLMRCIGARDLIIGIGLLRNRRPHLWLRVHALADVIDATFVAHGVVTGRVARWRGIAWFIFALGSAWVALTIARTTIASQDSGEHRN